jgi:hypothetical protein
MRYWENQKVVTNGLGEVIGVRGMSAEVGNWIETWVETGVETG